MAHELYFNKTYFFKKGKKAKMSVTTSTVKYLPGRPIYCNRKNK